jgi:hypothetical protein
MLFCEDVINDFSTFNELFFEEFSISDGDRSLGVTGAAAGNVCNDFERGTSRSLFSLFTSQSV